MPLTAGSRLGPYEVVAAIGAGGMGEVYRARDTKLDRDVALKILPDAFASDPDRLARFEREAKTLASLNHPNIAHIHGLEESSGAHALVMELVEGEDLSQRIARGAIPLGDSLPIARQIVDALEAAHEQGIIHRDLKPANIKVRHDGTVKVLDFGLAKALEPSGASRADAMNSPTLTARATQMGMIMGTAAYMAPEQARGRAVDRRADIWAFGCVLYEMLTGHRAFKGEDVSDTLAAVLRQDIDWAPLPATMPAPIQQLLRRCLERDPKRRLRDIGEARLVLESPDADRVSAATVSAPVSVSARPRFGLMHAISAVLLIALIASFLVRWPANQATSDAATRVSVVPPVGVTLDLATWPVVAISPDGSKVAFAARSKGVSLLYLRPLTEFEPRPLAGTEGAVNPFFSPDGTWIGFFAEAKLKKIPALGGPVVVLAEVADPRGGAWIDNDTVIYSPEPTTPLLRISAAGGAPTQVAPLDEPKHERTHRWPSVLPDGKTVLFTAGSIEHPDDYDEASIEAMRLDTGRRTFLAKGRMPRYVSTGHLLFARGRLLYAVSFDPTRLELHGNPVPVVDGVAGDMTTGAADYAVTDAGTLVFVPGDPSGAQHVPVWVDKKGTVTPIDVPPALYCDPHVAPDGRRVAVSIIDNASVRDVWVIDTARGTSSKLTFGGVNRTPIWSRDGKTLYYVAYDPAKNVSTITARAADQSGAPERVRELAGQVYLEDISPDGTVITLQLIGVSAGSTLAGAAKAAIKRLSLTNRNSEPELLVTTSGAHLLSAISPDGRWLAYVSTETGRNEVYVQSFTTGSRFAQISAAGGTEPHWSPDGRTLYYFQEPDQLVAVPIEAGAVFGAGRPQALLTGLTFWSLDSGQTYGLTPTGDRFIMMRQTSEHAAPDLRMILNWFSDLRQVPLSGRK
jgi:Tol biopolymer transport system component